MTARDIPAPPVEVPVVSPETLNASRDSGEATTILDTRPASDFESWHIDGDAVTAVNEPLDSFLGDGPDEPTLEPIPDDDRVVTVCAKGISSEYVAGVLRERGYDAAVLDRGMNGWASIYEYVELDTDGDATVAQYQRPSSGCLSYLVVSGDEAAVVDPLRTFADEYAADARALGADLVYAIDTHVHADHVSGVRAVADATDATPVLPAKAVERGITYDVETVADGDELVVGDAALDVIHTPGHTSGMTAYRVDDVVFTGDGLFVESVARPDLEDGDAGAADAARRLYDSLHDRVLSLPDDTVVAPGHVSDAAAPAADGTYTARLGDLTAAMDPLHLDREAFVDFVRSDMPPRPSNYEDIIATNLGEHDATDREAFELELGPNNCAASGDALTGE